MPTLNSYWAKYGCEKCDNYPLLVGIANFSDSKSTFQSWASQNNAKCKCIPKEDGGADFNTVLNNDNWGGPKYLIYPDKTFKKEASETDIINAGIQEHVCGAIYMNLSTPNGGETLEQNSTCTIKWSSNVSGNLKIELLKGGSLDKTITASTPNNGSYDWDITTDYVVGDDYKIKISSLDNDTVVAESNEYFSIIYGTPITNTNTITSTHTLTFYESRLHYRIPETEKQVHVSIELYNVKGKPVRTLVDKDQKAGSYFVELNKKQLLSSGVYLCRMETEGFQKTITILNK